jgi:hypothetical protein
VVVAKGKMATRELAAGVESRHVCRLVTGPVRPSQFDFFSPFLFFYSTCCTWPLGKFELDTRGKFEIPSEKNKTRNKTRNNKRRRNE